MPRFDRYILSQFLGVFGFFALVLVGVYWVNRAVKLFDQLIGSGQTALVFFEFSALSLPSAIKLVLPVAAFVATVYGGNRLVADSEMVVMQATGFSPFRLARPVAVFGLLVSVMMLVLTQWLVPMARTAADRQQTQMSENITAGFLQDGQFTHPSAGITLYIRKIAATGELLDLFLADDSRPDTKTTYTAGKALFLRTETGPKLLMFDGLSQEIDTTDHRLSVTRFADFTYDLGALMNHGASTNRDADAVSTVELLAPTPALESETGETAPALRYAGHARFADPLVALAAALIGFAALLQGSYSRMGLWKQIVLAIVLLVAMQALTTLAAGRGPKLAQGYLLAYVAPVFGIVVAVGLMGWAGRRRHLPRPRDAGAPGVAA